MNKLIVILAVIVASGIAFLAQLEPPVRYELEPKCPPSMAGKTCG